AEKSLSLERRVRAAKVNELAHEIEELARVGRERPIEPRNRVVLHVRVVVPALRLADLVAARDHRHALREEQRREEIPNLPRAELGDASVVRVAFDAAIEARRIVRAVL